MLDFEKPIAIMFMGVLGHAKSFEASHAIVARVMDAALRQLPGRVVRQRHQRRSQRARRELCQVRGRALHPATHRDIRGYFSGLEMVEPGLVSVTEWRPEPTDVGKVEPLPETTGGVARKP
jgi:S-adenosyl methyltransferase